MKTEGGVEDDEGFCDGWCGDPACTPKKRQHEIPPPSQNTPEKSGLSSAVYKSEEEAYAMYCRYAHGIGFSVRKDHHSYYPNSRSIRTKDFVCSKAGMKKDVPVCSQAKYRRANTRTGCPAMVRFAVDQQGEWTVAKWIESHNHELADFADRHLLRSSRKVSQQHGCVLKSMTDAGMGTNKVFEYITDEVGGVQNVGFSKRDAYNFVTNVRNERIERGDTNTLMELFKDRVDSDSMFKWDMQTDKEGRLVNFFWADGLSRIDYDCFGDVIVFDTTYRLNKYNLACAPFVGINQHWQNILFGVAFIAEETIESFKWVFNTFLRAMGGKYPVTIFTDQDQAMASAIEQVLPHTHHRLCQWHINRKAPSKVCCFNNNAKVRSLFARCFDKCDSELEFEQCWSDMIREGELEDHEWLKGLYKIRHKWSTAYSKKCFNIGILSTQRSESTNNVFHGISKCTSTLTDCFVGIEKVMLSWRRNESDEDFKCSQTTIVPVIKGSPILKQAARFYSRKIYSFFEDEFLKGVGGIRIDYVSTDSTMFCLKSLERFDYPGSWNVHVNWVTETIECTCGKFEMMGILCAHCIRVMHHLDILSIPSKYLIQRWSAKVRREFYALRKSMLETEKHNDQEKSAVLWRNYISKYFFQVTARAQGHKAAEEYLVESVVAISANIENMILGESPPSPLQTLRDPIKRRPKGNSSARLKSHWDKKKGTSLKRKKNTKTTNPQPHSFFPEKPEEPPATQQSTQQPTQENGNLNSIPECLTDEFLLGRPTPAPSDEYVKMLMELIESRRHP